MVDPDDEAEQAEKLENDTGLKPSTSIRKFDDLVTAVKLRQDGQLILCGDKLGKIQLLQVASRLALRQYKEFKNEIVCLDFASNNRNFVACANETSWKYFDIQMGDGAVFTCQKAHADHIKVVRFWNDELVLSASLDKHVKLWRIGDGDAEMVSSIKLPEAIEDVCQGPDGHLIVANGNMLSVLKVDEGDNLQLVSTIHAFQKPIMKVHYDANRQRVIAGGLD